MAVARLTAKAKGSLFDRRRYAAMDPNLERLSTGLNREGIPIGVDF